VPRNEYERLKSVSQFFQRAMGTRPAPAIMTMILTVGNELISL
jgi:hypothetical protein